MKTTKKKDGRGSAARTEPRDSKGRFTKASKKDQAASGTKTSVNPCDADDTEYEIIVSVTSEETTYRY